MKNTKFINYALGLSFLLLGCSSVDISSIDETNKGYFVSVFNNSIDYTCENKRKSMHDGKFECASFPISFYMKDVKLGEISTIHKDGYVYPQDIIVIENRVPIYSSEDSMGFLTIE